MNCLLSDKVSMQKEAIDENLEGHVCSKCGGVWIQAKAYWKWIKSQGHILPEKPESETLDLKVVEAKGIKICIDCAHFLTKRKVDMGFPSMLTDVLVVVVFGWIKMSGKS